jgi:hypothetical protein
VRKSFRIASGLSAALAAIAISIPAGGGEPERAGSPAPPPEVKPSDAKEPNVMAGAQGPKAGRIVVSGEAGMIFVLPHFTLGAMIGTGAGTSVELRYRNIAGAGHSGRLRLAWGTRISEHLAYGVSARTSITSLAQADGGLIGIQFSNIAVGNDWDVGSDLVLTWIRPGNANVTFSVGPTWTLGGVRYSTFAESEFRIEPGLRSILASVQGEWVLRRTFNVFLRLDAAFLIGTEIVPLGYVPTGSVGFAWSV